MHLILTKTYRDAYKLLSSYEQSLVKDALDIFRDNPFDVSLRNHSLRKPLVGQRAISVTDDLRIIFREKGGYTEVLMLDVGNHVHVYKNNL